MTKPIGILGGSFDPIHFGHLRLAKECIDLAGLDKVLFVPVNSPVHRSPLVANPDQRFEMLSLAIDNSSKFEISDCEIKRGSVSYTIDTLRALRKSYIDSPLCLIMGMDAFLAFDSWKDWEEIPEYAHLIITNRPNFNSKIDKPILEKLLNSRLSKDKGELATQTCGKIMMIEIPTLDISSSRIRELLRQGRYVDYLLPDPVIAYITTNKIYAGINK